MSEAVRVYIERVKAALGVTTDEQLAMALGYSKQAISSWRKRDQIPRKAEYRIVDLLGGKFAYGRPPRKPGADWRDEVVRGLAVFAVEAYTAHLPRPLALLHVRAIGRRMAQLEAHIRKAMISYDAYNEDEVLAIMMRMIERRLDANIDHTLAPFEEDGVLKDEQ